MYEFTPSADKRPGLLLAATCYAATVVLIMPVYPDWLLLWLRCAAVWVFVVGLLVTEKYVLSSFRYILEYNGTDYDFVIIETRLKKHRTVCRVRTAQIVAIKPKKQAVYIKGARRYNYCPGLVCRNRYVMTVEEENTVSAVTFTPDMKLLNLLTSMTGFKTDLT